MQSTVVLYNKVTREIKRVAASFDTVVRLVVPLAIKLKQTTLPKMEMSLEEVTQLCGLTCSETEIFLFQWRFFSVISEAQL